MTPTQLELQPCNTQAANLRRVGGAIGRDVLAFCRQPRIAGGRVFSITELAAWVQARSHRAPDSAGRILRLLRQRGVLDYAVVSRPASLYRVLWVK